MTLSESTRIYLDQAEDLLHQLDSETYSMLHGHCFGASIGGHLRHCLDHLHLLLQGAPEGRIDYDARDRELELERSPDFALRRLADLKARLEKLSAGLGEDATLQVKMDCGSEELSWCSSTLGRELQFIISHSIHHYAIIGIMCSSMGISLPENFGLAPSTIRHHSMVA